MPDIKNLVSRIDAEFSAVEQKVKKLQSQQAEQQAELQNRLERLNKVFDELQQGIWRPRLELLVKKFGDRVHATPRIVPSTREVTFEFQSHVARIRLKLSALTDRDVEKVVLSYDLDIIPVLMRFKNHAEIEFPLEGVDKEAATQWLDDRIVEFVQTYFSMGESEIYLKG